MNKGNLNLFIWFRLVTNRGKNLDSSTVDRINEFSYKVISEYPVDDITTESREFYCATIKYSSPFSSLYSYVTENWVAIIKALFSSCDDEDDFERVKELFDEFGQKYSDFIDNKSNNVMLGDMLSELADSRTNEWIKDGLSGVLSYKDFEDLKEEVLSNRRSIFNPFGLEDDTYDDVYFFHSIDVDEIINRNREWKDSHQETIKNVQKLATKEDEDMVKEIEVLYTGEYDEAFIKNKANELSLPF